MLTNGKPFQVFAGELRRCLSASSDILDIGTPCRFSKELRPFEGLFTGKRYRAAGYRPRMDYGAYNCDDDQDIQRMTYTDGQFDMVLCISVLEHVQDPRQASAEILRVLRPGGIAFVIAPFFYPFHGKKALANDPSHEGYPDYWRFTHQGIVELFRSCASSRVMPLGGPLEYRLKQLRLDALLGFGPLRWLVDRCDRPQVGRATTSHLLVATR